MSLYMCHIFSSMCGSLAKQSLHTNVFPSQRRCSCKDLSFGDITSTSKFACCSSFFLLPLPRVDKRATAVATVLLSSRDFPFVRCTDHCHCNTLATPITVCQYREQHMLAMCGGNTYCPRACPWRGGGSWCHAVWSFLHECSVASYRVVCLHVCGEHLRPCMHFRTCWTLIEAMNNTTVAAINLAAVKSCTMHSPPRPCRNRKFCAWWDCLLVAISSSCLRPLPQRAFTVHS